MQVSSPQVCPSGLHCMGEDEVPVAYYAKSLQAAHRVVLVGTNAWFGIVLFHRPPTLLLYTATSQISFTYCLRP